MGRFRLFAGLALLVLCGVIIVSSYYLGGRAQQEYAALFAEDAAWASRAGLNSERVGYDRGIFSSNATTRITPRNSKAPAILVHHDIRHGPVTLQGERLFCLARVKSIAELEPGNGSTPLRTAFQNKLPLRARTHIALDGSVLSRIESPEDRWQSRDREFAWGGLNGTVTVLQGGERGMDLDFELPRLEIDVPGRTGDVTVNGLRLSRTLRRNDRGDMINGTASLRCSSVEAHTARGSIRAESLAMNSSTDSGNGLLESETRLGWKKGRLGEMALLQGDFRMRLENLHAGSLRRWRELLHRAEDVSREQLEGIAADFLAASPRMERAELRMDTAEGPISWDTSARFDGSGELSVRNRQGMIRRIQAESRLSVPRSVGIALATIPARFVEDLALGEDSKQKSGGTDTRARAWLGKLRELGYISLDSGRYEVKMKLEKGMLSVKDKPVLPLDIFL